MENVETRDLLIEKIGESLSNLSSLEPGSKERATEVENLTKLYRLKIDETKNELDYFEKQDRRVLEKELHEAEEKLKREQMQKEEDAKVREEELKKEENKNEWLRLAANLGINCAVSVITLLAYNGWYNRGLKFHQTDTLTEPMTKNLVSKMTNLLPWKK